MHLANHHWIIFFHLAFGTEHKSNKILLHAAVVFSGVSFLSIANNALFFRAKPSINVCLGALVGISGLCVFFWHEVTGVTLGDNTLTGLGLATIGTFIFSLGSSISK